MQNLTPVTVRLFVRLPVCLHARPSIRPPTIVRPSAVRPSDCPSVQPSARRTHRPCAARSYIRPSVLSSVRPSVRHNSLFDCPADTHVCCPSLQPPRPRQIFDCPALQFIATVPDQRGCFFLHPGRNSGLTTLVVQEHPHKPLLVGGRLCAGMDGWVGGRTGGALGLMDGQSDASVGRRFKLGRLLQRLSGIIASTNGAVPAGDRGS